MTSTATPQQQERPHNSNSAETFWRDDFAPLEAAGKAVLAALRDDEAAPDADLYRRIVSSGPGSHLYYPSESGMDGAAAAGSSSSSANVTGASPSPSAAAEGGTGGPAATRPPPTATLVHRRSVPLPPYLARELKTTRTSTLMGLLPEADLAWLSVDEKLYLWSFDPASGFPSASADGGIENLCSLAIPSGQCVVSVGLVRPKKGVFKDSVEWCLVVTTPVEAVLCALARSDGETTSSPGTSTEHGQGALRLIPTHYVIPTDSAAILSVCGTSDGRILMGGSDGCLYEMTYDGLVNQGEQRLPPSTLEQRLNTFYDGEGPQADRDIDRGNNSVAQNIVTSGKRAFSSVMFGSSANRLDGSLRPRKCRKLNHSARGSSVARAVVPDFMLNVSSALFGSAYNSTSGGPIVSVVVDEERCCVYTLSSRGWICVFDLFQQGSTPSAPSEKSKLMAVVDAPKTARLYLESVSRGRMYPPSSSHSASIANITFPGGGSSAQAGVGGMDGARSILKLADSEVQRNRNARGARKADSSNILTPVSIHVVPRKESGRLTLVAVTAGGLRYYLSSLSSSVLNSGPGQHMGSSRKTDPLAPSRKFTLCHVRAPPPVGSNGLVQDLPSFEADSFAGLDGLSPKVATTGGKMSRVDASYYGDGDMVLALKYKGESDGAASSRYSTQASNLASSQSASNGDIIVSTAPDFVLRKKILPSNVGSTAPQQQLTTAPGGQLVTAPGGICETLSLPMATLSDSSSIAPTLPGGRVWNISSKVLPESSSLLLTLGSETPTDAELGVGLVPAYFPPSRVESRASKQAKTSSSGAAPISPLDVATAGRPSSQLVANGGSSVASIVVGVLTNFMLSRPLRQGISFQKLSPQLEDGAGGSYRSEPLYRISARYGYGSYSFAASGKCARGKRAGTQGTIVAVKRSESSSADALSPRTSTSIAPRLSPWLLRPAVVPLNPLAIQHLVPSSGVVALNAGGLHYFHNAPVLSNLTEVLMSSGPNMGRDESVTNFFKSYGYGEGCAMCLVLAVGCGPGAANGSIGEELRSRALRAALSHGLVPSLVLVADRSNQTSIGPQVSSSRPDASVPPGYEFHPSALSDGLTALLSRLLRPVWYKPAVVVTEGRTIRRKGGGAINTPAKVELLLDDVTLEEIRKPLYAMQTLMRDVFSRAVSVIPGVQQQEIDRMEIDGEVPSGGHEHLITRAMQHQGLVRNQINGGSAAQLSSSEIESIARLVEERYLHSMYRLLSRTVQLLSLLSLLKRAQLMPDLPEVEWGLLHGLTISQLVQTRLGQARMEALLNSLVSSGTSVASPTVTPSADADRLASLLASQCYLYFSPGSRLAYQGFRSANAALSCPTASARRAALTNQASAYLKGAARYWYSAPLVTGRILHPSDKRSYVQMALRAMQFDSPVAKAAAALIQLGDVVGVVDVCLETASNFGGRAIAKKPYEANTLGVPAEESAPDMLVWEQGLYHIRRQHVGDAKMTGSTSQASTTSSPSTALAVGAVVTPTDAIRTCYAIIFHHLTTLLDSPDIHLAEKMVSVCAAQSDKSFLHALYEHLLDTNHVSTLLKIKSSELEKWLQRPEADETLLWRYYEFQRKNVLAGEVMWKRACDVQLETSLDERIDCLTRALNSYTNALNENTSAVNLAQGWNRSLSSPRPDDQELQRIVTEIQETLDVATLQNRLLNTITSSALEDKLNDSQLSRLKSTLVPVSDLYNDYAGPLNLFDLCLLILHSCHHNDVNTIQTLWKSVFCEEIFPCSTRSSPAYHFLQNLMAGSLVEESIVLVTENGETNSSFPLFENGDWINGLKGRVVSLGKEVYGHGADYVFPVEFIAANLEGLRRVHVSSVSASESPLSVLGSRPWPLSILVDVGVPFVTILEAYESMAEREDAELMGGSDQQKRLQHLSSLAEVLAKWVSAAESFRNGTGLQNVALLQLTRAVSPGGLIARIDSYKASLEGMIGGRDSDDVARVCQALDEIEDAINRLV